MNLFTCTSTTAPLHLHLNTCTSPPAPLHLHLFTCTSPPEHSRFHKDQFERKAREMTKLHAKQKEDEGVKEVEGVKRAMEEEEKGGKRMKV